VQQLIGVKAAFHQDGHVAFGGQRRCRFSGGMAVGDIDAFDACQIQASVGGHFVNFAGWADQHGHDQAMPCSVKRAAE
jgi:hypothetical protein